jgi:hypothetical protein
LLTGHNQFLLRSFPALDPRLDLRGFPRRRRFSYPVRPWELAVAAHLPNGCPAKRNPLFQFPPPPKRNFWFAHISLLFDLMPLSSRAIGSRFSGYDAASQISLSDKILFGVSVYAGFVDGKNISLK